MDQRNQQAELAAEARRRQLRRRVRRGIVAGYIHELSARHRRDGLVATPRSAAKAAGSPA